MRGVNKVVSSHHQASKHVLRLVGGIRGYASLPEPPSNRKKSIDFTATTDFAFNKHVPPPGQRQPPRLVLPNSEPIRVSAPEKATTPMEKLQQKCDITTIHQLLQSRNLEPEQAKEMFELAKTNKVATAQTYSILAKYYAKRGKTEESKNLQKEAEEAGMHLDPSAIASLVFTFIQQHDLPYAEKLFHTIMHSKESFNSYATMLRAYYNASRFNEFDEVLQAMFNNHITIPERPDVVVFVAWLVKTLYTLGRNVACAQLYRIVRTKRIALSAEVYANIIRCLDKEDSSEMKQVVLDMKAKGVPFDARLYYLIIRSLNKHDPQLAKELGDEMLNSGINLDARTYNAYLHVCVRHGTSAAAQDALNAVARMRKANIAPDLLSYTNLLKACGLAGELDKCDAILQEMVESGLAIQGESFTSVFATVPPELGFKLVEVLKKSGVKPDVVFFNLMLKRADVESATQIREKMDQEGVQPDSITFNTLMGVYGKARNLQKCQELLKEMETKSVTTDVWAYNSMIPALDLEQPSDAMAWLKQMRERGVAPDEVTYNALIAILHRKTKESLVPLWDDMKQHGVKPSVYSYNLFIKAQGQSGDTASCETLLTEMRQKEILPDVVSYTTCFDYISDPETLHRLLSQMDAEHVQPQVTTYISLLRQCAKNNDAEWAKELLKDGERRHLISQQHGFELQAMLQRVDGLSQVAEKLAEFRMSSPQ